MKATTNVSKAKSRRGFTLVEMLVVIGMIGALAGISFPVYKSIQKKVERQKWDMVLMNLDRAFVNFETEYNYLPSAGGSTGGVWQGDEYLSTPAQMTLLITILAGAESGANLVNFKSIAFLDGSPEANASGGGYESGFHVNNDDTMSLYSPWGEEMKAVVIDTDMNGELRYPYTGGTYYSTSRKFLWWDWGPDDVWNNSDDYGNFDHPDAPWN